MSARDLLIIGAGPAGLAAASTAARAGLATLLLDENAGVGGQIYRGITATPVKNRTVLGEDYWAGLALANEAALARIPKAFVNCHSATGTFEQFAAQIRGNPA